MYFERNGFILEKKKKKFKLFDMNRDGKGVEKNEDLRPTFINFFKNFFRKFPHLLRLNILMIFQIIPFILIVCLFFLGPKSPTMSNVMFAPLYGLNQASGGAAVSSVLDLSSIQMGFPVFSPAVNVTIICLLVVLAITWGWQNIGATYVLRGLVRGDPVFVFSDFFYAIKKNLKQGFLLGLIDFIICAVLAIDFLFFYQKTGSFGLDFMYFAIFALIIVWFIMRFYIYNLLITFDIKIFKLIKNAFIFSILGIGRNILALLGIVILVVLHLLLIWFTVPIGISIPIILPFFYLLAATAFMACYAAYPIIDRYMIAPYAAANDEEEFIYLKENSEEEATESDDESITSSSEEKDAINEIVSEEVETEVKGKKDNKKIKNKK